MLLRTRIMVFTSLGIFAVVFVLALASHKNQTSAEIRFEKNNTRAKQILWDKIVSGEQVAMEESISGLTRDRQLRKALRAKDYEVIKEQSITSFYRLSASKIIDRMDISDASGDIKFSTPEPISQWGDKALIESALDTGKISKGIVLLDGTPHIQLAFPLSYRGKLIGVGIYSKGLDQAIQELKQLDSSEVAIFGQNKELSTSTQFELYQQLGLNKAIDNNLSFLRRDINQKILAVSINPILDPNNNIIAYLSTANDQTDSYQQEDQIQLSAVAISLAMISAVIFALMSYIRRAFLGIDLVIDKLKNIAAGDLSVDINKGQRNDEIGQLGTATSTMVTQLKAIIQKVRAMATQLQDAIQAMDNIVEETNQGVQNQLQETRRVSDTIADMSISVNEVANHANVAADNAQEASQDALAGEEIVQSSIQSIEQLSKNIDHSASVVNQLNESSQEIGSVLDVIRGIAEQTNLLALNAAIEAARAGEQGRGFAVVADEVRTLASRTQKSTQDIQSTIEQLQAGSQQAVSSMENSIDQVSTNLEHSQKTSDSLSTIALAIEQINNMNTQIATATDKQSQSTMEISDNLQNISKLAEKSANGAKETSACTSQLNHMAGDLTKLVAHFSL